MAKEEYQGPKKYGRKKHLKRLREKKATKRESKTVEKSVARVMEAVPSTSFVTSTLDVLPTVEAIPSTSAEHCMDPASPATSDVSLVVEDLPTTSAERPQSPSGFSNLTGRRIVDIGHFARQWVDMMQHGVLSCPPTALSFLKEERRGLISTYYFECRMCGVQRTNTSEPSDAEAAATANFAATMGAMSVGGGHALLEEVTGALDIPAMSKPTFAKYHKKVADTWEKLALKVMEDAAKEEARLAKEANEVDADGCPCILVVVDGSWAKRP